MIRIRSQLSRLALAIMAVAPLLSCEEPRRSAVVLDNQDTGRSLVLHVADSLYLRLHTTGLGSWVNPPAVSGPALRFIDESEPGRASPGGTYQLLRFVAADAGTATVAVSWSSSGPPGAVGFIVSVSVQ